MSDVREASLEPDTRALPGGFIGQAGPFALLGVAALWLAARWQRLPARIPVHWNFRGDADRFVSRSFSGAGGPLLAGAVLCAILLALQLGIRHGAPRAASRFAMLKVTLAAEYLVALTFCGLLAVSGSGGRHLAAFVVASGAGVMALLAFTVSMVRGSPPPEPRNRAAWHGGIFYADRDDPAIFVPKRLGTGYTFNFGNPVAVAMMAGLLLLPLIAVWLAAHAR